MHANVLKYIHELYTKNIFICSKDILKYRQIYNIFKGHNCKYSMKNYRIFYVIFYKIFYVSIREFDLVRINLVAV